MDTKDAANCVAVFAGHPQAEAAIRQLQCSGFDMKKLSIVSSILVGTLEGAAVGAAIGGGTGARVAALTSAGNPKDSVIRYERDLKA